MAIPSQLRNYCFSVQRRRYYGEARAAALSSGSTNQCLQRTVWKESNIPLSIQKLAVFNLTADLQPDLVEDVYVCVSRGALDRAQLG